MSGNIPPHKAFRQVANAAASGARAVDNLLNEALSAPLGGPTRPTIPDFRVSDPEATYLLPDSLLKLLEPSLSALGYPISQVLGEVYDPDFQRFKFHQVALLDGYIAFLYIGDRMLEDGSQARHFSWMAFAWTDEVRGGHAKAMYFFSDATRVADAYRTMGTYFLSTGKILKVEFFDQNLVSRLERLDEDARKVFVKEKMGLDGAFTPMLPVPQKLSLSDLSQNDSRIDEIVEILRKSAANAPPNLGTKGYFRRLIDRTRWRDEWKDERKSDASLTGDPETDARNLINWAIDREINQDYPGETVVGELLVETFRDLGDQDEATIRSVITEYELIIF